jgi:hypothetical protein
MDAIQLGVDPSQLYDDIPFFSQPSDNGHYVGTIQAWTPLITITMDQHQVVWHPLRKRLNKKKARILICFLWILAISASVPVLIYARIIKFPANGGNDGVCMEDWETPEERYIYSVTVMVLQYFLPLAIMICCYTHIGVIVWLTKIPGEIIHRQDKRQNRSKRKVIYQILYIKRVVLVL